jgi:diguanylate cyclase (GGDEF)-like protein
MGQPAVSVPTEVSAKERRTVAPRAEFERVGLRSALLFEESTANEQTIALWRLMLCLVAAVQVGVRVSFRPERLGTGEWASLVCASAAVLYSVCLFVLISRSRYATWLSYVSVGMDVTLITFALLVAALMGHPLAAVNTDLSVPLFLLALALAGLRYDPRVTVFATALALIEYALFVAYAVVIGAVYDAQEPEVLMHYGQFDLMTQLTRLLLIGCGGVVATFGVRRARDLRTASMLDALTQVFNRGFLEERFANEFSRAERYERDLSILLLDVDHFKFYNDRHGHAAGDQVLREIADILRFGLRGTDTVARYGGEEFLALLPETSKEIAVRLAERLRQQVANHPFLHRSAQPGGTLTVSIGVATYPGDANTLDALFEHADQALYRAKGDGRNAVRG